LKVVGVFVFFRAPPAVEIKLSAKEWANGYALAPTKK
jgi:hypothetical protein